MHYFFAALRIGTFFLTQAVVLLLAPAERISAQPTARPDQQPLTIPSLYSASRVSSGESRYLKRSQDTIDMSTQMDVYDLLAKLSPRWRSFRKDTAQKQAGKLYFTLLPLISYAIQTSVMGGVAGNLAFYTSEGSKANISNITYMAAYTLHKQTVFIVQPNVWLEGNRYNLVGSMAYVKYPQETYGLGGHTALADASRVNYSYIRVYETALRQMATDFFLGLGYDLDYHYNITESTTSDRITDFRRYGFSDRSISSGLTANLLFDNRRNSIAPRRGCFLNIIYRNNPVFLGSNSNWQSLTIDARTYFKLPRHSRNVLALWSYNWLTPAGDAPYLDLPSTGWDDAADTGRGYAQGRFRGKNMIYQEAEYRFGLTRNGLLGGVVFVNAQTFSEWPGNNYDVIQPGYGTGLRIKFNKYSQTNLCVDYGFGTGNSHGLFVNLCEMF